MPEPFLHHRQHFLIVSAFSVEHARRPEPRPGQTRREQVAARQGPENGALPAPEPSGDPGQELGGPGIVCKRSPGSGDLVQTGHGKAAAGQPPVDCIHSERQAVARYRRTRRFDRAHLCPEGSEAFGSVRA